MLKDRSAFWNQKKYAVVGVSKDRNKFGRKIYDEMKKRNFDVVGINAKPFDEEGIALFQSLRDIPSPPDAVILVVPPKVTESIVRECGDLGIKHVWIQPGADSKEAIRYCEENGLNVIHHECVLMQMDPVRFPHNVHRWIEKVF